MTKLSTRVERLEAERKPGVVMLWVNADDTEDEKKAKVAAHLTKRGLASDADVRMLCWQSN